MSVLDRQSGPALETSFANAGEVSPGYSSPWAAPGIPIKALKWLFMRHRPLFIWPKPDPGLIRWGLRMLRNCTCGALRDQQGPDGAASPNTAATWLRGAARRARHRL